MQATAMTEVPFTGVGFPTPVDLDGFRAMMRDAGVEEYVDATLEVYLGEVPERIVALNEAVTSRDPSRIAFAAHAMRSAARSIRADVFADLLRRMEEIGRSGDPEPAVDLIDEVTQECDSVLSFLKNRVSDARQ